MLKTWIPGTTDFRDQGLDPTDWVNDNVEISNDGKLGKCLYFNGSNARLSSHTYSLGEKWSWSVWIKDDPDVTGWRIAFILNSNGSDADTQTALWVKADETRLEVCNDAKWVSTVKYVPGQWNHIAQTYDGTTTNVYLNGSRISGFTSTDHLVRTNMTIGGRSTNVDGGHVSANMYYKGYLNDFRIWNNEVLSPQQIKRLSQGLCLHYRLSGVGRLNNIKRSAIIQKSSTMTYDSGEYTFVCPYLDSTWGVGFYINDTSISWKSGETWLISMDVYTPQSISWNADINNKPDVEDQSSYTGNDYDITSERKSCTNGSLTSKTLKAGWNKIWYTQKAPTTYGLYNYSTNFGIVTTGLGSGNSITVKIRNIKGEIIEDGDVLTPTPWIPNPSDPEYSTMGLDDGIEYDCSGFGNNGMKAGTITWDSNTARYNSCYAMTGTSYINCGKPYEFIPDGSEEFTVNMWAYEDAWDTSNQLCSCTESGGFSLSTGNNAVTCYCHVYRDSSILTNSSGETITNSSGDTILLSTSAQYIAFTQSYTLSSGWHMFTMVYTKEGLKIYVDGSLVRNSESSSIGLHYNKNCNLFIGAEANGSGGCTSPYLEGKASDYRLFSTALDDDSILALYNLGGSLDSNGVFHTYEYTEQ